VPKGSDICGKISDVAGDIFKKMVLAWDIDDGDYMQALRALTQQQVREVMRKA
jgi:hypothetical protein